MLSFTFNTRKENKRENVSSLAFHSHHSVLIHAMWRKGSSRIGCSRREQTRPPYVLGMWVGTFLNVLHAYDTSVIARTQQNAEHLKNKSACEGVTTIGTAVNAEG